MKERRNLAIISDIFRKELIGIPIANEYLKDWDTKDTINRYLKKVAEAKVTTNWDNRNEAKELKKQYVHVGRAIFLSVDDLIKKTKDEEVITVLKTYVYIFF